MNKKASRTLLLVEDNPGDARLLREMLIEEGLDKTDVTHAACMREAEKYLAEDEFDIIVLDLGLPDADGLGAVRRTHAAAPGVPLVVLTGLDDESMAVQALHAGAQDYLVKGQIGARGLLRALRYAIERKILDEARTAGAKPVRTIEAPLRASTQQLARDSVADDLTTGQVPWSNNLHRILGVDKRRFAESKVSGIRPAKSVAPSVISYRPVWDVKREVLSTYFSRRSAVFDAGPDELSRLDLEALRAGIKMLAALYQRNLRMRLSFSINFEAIVSAPHFRAYTELCRTIPEDLRKLVAFELVDLPMGVQHRRLGELAVVLRHYCGLLLATVDWWRADLSQFANTGIGLVNAVISPGSSEKGSMTDMDSFAYATGKAGLLSAVEGVGTSSLALAAKAAGVDFISGDRIGPCLEIPHSMVRMSWDELYMAKRPTA
jgi:DNA-binding response OmpR family regulator